jgi:hypothetical protein
MPKITAKKQEENNNKLLDACENLDLFWIQEMLDQGANPSVYHSSSQGIRHDGDFGLHLCIRKFTHDYDDLANAVACIKALLDAGADVNEMSRHPTHTSTALHLVLDAGAELCDKTLAIKSIEITRFLMEQGARHDIRCSFGLLPIDSLFRQYEGTFASNSFFLHLDFLIAKNVGRQVLEGSMKRIGDMAASTPRLKDMVTEVYEKMVSAGARVGAIGKEGLIVLNPRARGNLLAKELAIKEASELAKITKLKSTKAKPMSRKSL